MNIDRIISVIDTHTAGEPTRIITGGLPRIRGNSMLEKRNYFAENFDDIRTMVLREPRGHNDMFGAALVEPVNPMADLGVIFMSTGNFPQAYPYMCGHGTIGIFTIAVELGMVKKKEPVTSIAMDTPDGLVKGWVKIKNDVVTEVEIESIPAFSYKENVVVNGPGFNDIRVDIAYNSGFFALCPAKSLGLKICPANASLLSQKAIELRDVINKTIQIDFIEKSHFKTVDVIEFFDDPENPKAHCKNVVIFGAGQVDRSPCGTGTSAKMAVLYSKGLLNLNEPFVHESIIGTLFKGKIIDAYEESGYTRIVPRIASSAQIIGINQLISEKSDPLKNGFQLG